MRLTTIASGTVLLLGMLSAGGAMAATQDLSGTLGATTCANFTAMSASAQADMVTQSGQAGTQSSLTSTSGNAPGSANGSTTAGATASSSMTASSGDTSTVPDMKVDAGQLVAACQAASPGSTLQDAFSHFNTGANGTGTVSK